jgi:tetratricopeptide (TPR) repeat protein
LATTDLYRRGYTLKDVRAADAAVRAVGMARGRFCLEWYEHVLQLKRDEQYEEALSLLMEILAATERMRDQETVNIPVTAALRGCDDADVRIRPPGPAWTEQAAIICRKLGRLDDELAIIDRWLARNGPNTESSSESLAKMRVRRAKAERLLERLRNSWGVTLPGLVPDRFWYQQFRQDDEEAAEPGVDQNARSGGRTSWLAEILTANVVDHDAVLDTIDDAARRMH